MMSGFKKPLLFILALLPVAVIAGIFVGYYQLDTLSDEAVAEFIAQAGSAELLVLVGAIQTVVYALFCGFFGYILADKLGLLKPPRFEKRSVLVTLISSIVAGILLSLDYWIFGAILEGVRSAAVAGLTFSGVIASVLYGGVIEEIILRLFFMSLIAFLAWKLFFRKCKKDTIPATVFVIANVTSALVFAIGHLPTTVAIFGELTPLLIFRCFLYNGGFGLLFGYLYRKYGIAYAMMSHAVCHIVSKLIWFIFI